MNGKWEDWNGFPFDRIGYAEVVWSEDSSEFASVIPMDLRTLYDACEFSWKRFLDVLLPGNSVSNSSYSTPCLFAIYKFVGDTLNWNPRFLIVEQKNQPLHVLYGSLPSRQQIWFEINEEGKNVLNFIYENRHWDRFQYIDGNTYFLKDIAYYRRLWESPKKSRKILLTTTEGKQFLQENTHIFTPPMDWICNPVFTEDEKEFYFLAACSGETAFYKYSRENVLQKLESVSSSVQVHQYFVQDDLLCALEEASFFPKWYQDVNAQFTNGTIFLRGIGTPNRHKIGPYPLTGPASLDLIPAVQKFQGEKYKIRVEHCSQIPWYTPTGNHLQTYLEYMNMQTGKLLRREKIENPSPVFMRCEQPCPYWRSPTQAISLKTSVLRNTQGFPEILLIEENHVKNTSRILGPYVNVNSPWFSPDGTHWSAIVQSAEDSRFTLLLDGRPYSAAYEQLIQVEFPSPFPSRWFTYGQRNNQWYRLDVDFSGSSNE